LGVTRKIKIAMVKTIFRARAGNGFYKRAISGNVWFARVFIMSSGAGYLNPDNN
jgi:hypothetical protein